MDKTIANLKSSGTVALFNDTFIMYVEGDEITSAASLRNFQTSPADFEIS